ncbi:Hypothetical predicted protein [Podarcis lilfordi]|uniref:Uncharacterized protein n=1 Tax=Podarcis lilfordi TaxID=74358 RepID=A0AA35PGA2_9SAUR|nr:Hypothetical predicted protein [Podarcis lilfordi]
MPLSALASGGCLRRLPSASSFQQEHRLSRRHTQARSRKPEEEPGGGGGGGCPSHLIRVKSHPEGQKHNTCMK